MSCDVDVSDPACAFSMATNTYSTRKSCGLEEVAGLGCRIRCPLDCWCRGACGSSGRWSRNATWNQNRGPVQASHGKVVAPPHRHVGLELQHIEAVAPTAEASTGRRVRFRHVIIPDRLNCGTDS